MDHRLDPGIRRSGAESHALPRLYTAERERFLWYGERRVLGVGVGGETREGERERETDRERAREREFVFVCLVS